MTRFLKALRCAIGWHFWSDKTYHIKKGVLYTTRYHQTCERRGCYATRVVELEKGDSDGTQ